MDNLIKRMYPPSLDKIYVFIGIQEIFRNSTWVVYKVLVKVHHDLHF